MGCAEPTATYQRAGTSAILEPRQNNSYSFSPIDRTVYVRLTSVRTEGGDPIRPFMRRMFESADSAGAKRLVLDLRSVSEGDTFLVVPLLKGVIARDRFLKRGGLFVVVGRDSFSPRQSAATLLGQHANPVFVTSPAGLSAGLLDPTTVTAMLRVRCHSRDSSKEKSASSTAQRSVSCAVGRQKTGW